MYLHFAFAYIIIKKLKLICMKILRTPDKVFLFFFRTKHGGVTENVWQTIKFAVVGSRVKFHPTDAAAERIIKCSYKEFQRGISEYSSKPVMKCILLKQIKE